MLVRTVTIAAAVTAPQRGCITVALALLVALASAAILWRVRGTTLAAPAAWGVASALVIATVEAGIAWSAREIDPLTASLARYSAAMGTFCPVMAVLGAKRPQDRGWQWVVLSLWIVLLVPAAQALAAPSGYRLELFSAWRLLLWSLTALGLLNYLPTRIAFSAALFALAQLGLLAEFLFDVQEDHGERRIGALSLLLLAIAAAFFAHRKVRRQTKHPSPDTDSLSRRWFVFRDGWGAFWGLRVLQRINQTAELSHWPVRLHWWTGFEPYVEGDDAVNTAQCLNQQTAAHIQQTLDSLLRRFERQAPSQAT
jgi:hypothetical protein